MQYIDADRLRAEIERRKRRNMDVDIQRSIGRYYEDRDLLALLDSLQQEPAELDEDDKVIMQYLLDFLEDPITAKMCPQLRKECQDWMKSIPERLGRSSWKPSIEQLAALDGVIADTDCSRAYVLRELWNQLKKL